MNGRKEMREEEQKERKAQGNLLAELSISEKELQIGSLAKSLLEH